MPALSFASLTPTQQAQAAQIFQDVIFGSDPAAYTYELQADGQLTGQRSQVAEIKEKKLRGKRSPMTVFTSGKVQLTDQAAHVLARMILPGLLTDPAALIDTVTPSALSVGAPSLIPSGWEQGGWCE